MWQIAKQDWPDRTQPLNEISDALLKELEQAVKDEKKRREEKKRK